MSNPNPHASEHSYPSEIYKPVRKGFKKAGKTKVLRAKKESKYDAMIDSSKAHPESPLGRMHRLMK